jgi:nitroreductase
MSSQTKASSTVDDAILSRRSVREFLSTPVDLRVVSEILSVASRAPSGHNTQPWQVHVMTGDALQRVGALVLNTFNDPEKRDSLRPGFDAYPPEWVPPFVDRRRRLGKDLYGLLGIEKGDRARMDEQMGKNFTFFGAPVGLMFTLHRFMVPGSIMDLGIFLQSVMLLARARGLDTCAQGAFAPFNSVLSEDLAMAPDEVVICGMAMGYADETATVNKLETHRDPVPAFCKFHS